MHEDREEGMNKKELRAWYVDHQPGDITRYSFYVIETDHPEYCIVTGRLVTKFMEIRIPDAIQFVESNRCVLADYDHYQSDETRQLVSDIANKDDRANPWTILAANVVVYHLFKDEKQ